MDVDRLFATCLVPLIDRGRRPKSLASYITFVNDLQDLDLQKHFTLLRLELSTEELPSLDEWIEKFQLNVSYFSFDHTKLQANLSTVEIDWKLDQLCADIELSELNQTVDDQ